MAAKLYLVESRQLIEGSKRWRPVEPITVFWTKGEAALMARTYASLKTKPRVRVTRWLKSNT